MALSKDEKIVRLRRGIASSETSDALRSIMQADLDELLKPEPEYVAPVVKVKPPAKKAVKVKKEATVIETKAPEPPPMTEDRKKAQMEEIQREKARKKAKAEEEN